MAPQVGFEPTTDRLTADCSTTELLWNNNGLSYHFLFHKATLFWLSNVLLSQGKPNYHRR